MSIIEGAAGVLLLVNAAIFFAAGNGGKYWGAVCLLVGLLALYEVLFV